MKTLYGIIKGTDEFLSRIIDAVIILVLLVSIYLFVDTKIIFDSLSVDKITQYKPTTPNESRELIDKYHDYVFWLEITDTKVDFPVVQSENNSEYLNKAPDGSYSLSGSIFLDSRSSADLSDDYSVLYGHYMDGAMFGYLIEFKDKSYFNSHRTGYFLLKDGTWIDFEVIAFIGTDSSEQIIFNPQHPGDRVEWARENATNFAEPKDLNAKIVALTTCVSPSSSKRNVVLVSLKDPISPSEG